MPEQALMFTPVLLLSAALVGQASPAWPAATHPSPSGWIVRQPAGPMVGDEVPVPAVIQRFITLYQEGKVDEAVALLWDPLERIFREQSQNSTASDKAQMEEVKEKLPLLRAMMKWKLSAAVRNFGPPQIDVLRSFRADKNTDRVHLRIRHRDYTFFIKLTTTETPIGVIVNGISFGDDQADIFGD